MQYDAVVPVVRNVFEFELNNKRNVSAVQLKEEKNCKKWLRVDN